MTAELEQYRQSYYKLMDDLRDIIVLRKAKTETIADCVDDGALDAIADFILARDLSIK
jgi:hypothetical protein